MCMCMIWWWEGEGGGGEVSVELLLCVEHLTHSALDQIAVADGVGQREKDSGDGGTGQSGGRLVAHVVGVGHSGRVPVCV